MQYLLATALLHDVDVPACPTELAPPNTTMGVPAYFPYPLSLVGGIRPIP